MMVLIRHHMVVAPKAGEAPVKPIDVWANQTQKSASWLGLDSPFFGATTIIRWYGVRSAPSQQGLLHAPRGAVKSALRARWTVRFRCVCATLPIWEGALLGLKLLFLLS